MPDRRSLALALAGAFVVVGGWLIAAADGAPRAVGPEPLGTTGAPAAEARSEPAERRTADQLQPAPAGDRGRREVPPATGANDGPPPAAVSGRVVDELGRPVAGARVVLVHATQRTRSRTADRLNRFFEGHEDRQVRMSTTSWDPLAGGVPEPIIVFGTLDANGAVRVSTEQPVVRVVYGEALTFASGAETLIGVHGGGQLLSARTDADGRFEIRGEVVFDAPLTVRASAPLHLDGDAPIQASGTEVVITVRRGAFLDSRIEIPDWLPAQAVSLQLRPASGDGRSIEGQPIDGPQLEEPDERAVRVGAGTVEAGTYELTVRVAGMPEPVYRVPDLALVVGDRQPDTRGTRIDMRHAVFRYEVRAIDGAGRPILELASPLLARVADGEASSWTAFPWRGGEVEFFGARPTIDVVAFAPGYRRRNLSLSSGVSELRLARLPPVEVVLPGLRALCGPEHKVRISMVREGDTGMPSSIQAVDPRSGESQGYSRWHLGVSGGAWLGETDVVEVPLVLDGRYSVIVRLHREEVPGDVSIELAEIDVSFDVSARPRTVIAIDADQIRAGLAQLRERAER